VSLEAPAPATVAQRWRERRDSYRPAGEPIRAESYGVEVVEEREARRFVEAHHYSGSFPAARLSVGLFRVGVGLVGAAVFAVPTNYASARMRLGIAGAEAVALSRFVLLDNVEANGETWFLARAFAALRSELSEVRGVLSYADPMARSRADGSTVKPGHVGTIYQAANARYLGRTKPERIILTADGRSISPRTLSKLRNDERGAGYAYRQLVEAGAPERRAFEDGRAYVARALESNSLRTLRHPGQHVYTWATARDLALPNGLPYPKKELVA
jgi:hypothetical protein